MEAVQDHSKVTDPTGLTILLAIARFTGPNGEPAWPSVRTIADVAHCNKDTVTRWVHALEEMGELTTRKEGAGRGTRMYYTINLPLDAPKHGGAGRGDNTRTMSPSGGDNNHGDNTRTMSPDLERLSLQIERLSLQLDLLSPSTPGNVPTWQGQKPETIETEEKPNGKPEDRARDLENHPAVSTYVEITETWPGKDKLPFLVQALGEDIDRPALEKAWMFWVASDHKLLNTVGVVEWYQKIRQNPEWTPGMRFNGARASLPASGQHDPNADRKRRLRQELKREGLD